MKTASLLVAASMSFLGLAACDPEGEAPAEPEPLAGAAPPPDSLDGTYNLRQAACATGDHPETRLVVAGNRFNFYESSCIVTSSETGPQSLDATLACIGEGSGFNRNVTLQTRPGTLRLTQESLTLTYFKCGA